jgi:hypothetical protein
MVLPRPRRSRLTVTIATPSGAVANLIPHESVGPLLARLGRGNTEFRILTGLDGVSSDGARLVNLTSGEEYLVPCGAVVVQTGRAPVAGQWLP